MRNVVTLDRSIRLSLIVLLAAVCALPAARGQAAPTAPQYSVKPGLSPADPSVSSAPGGAEEGRMMRDMMKQRNNLRQKQIVDDTNQLLDLAKQLKDAVDKSDKDQLSIAVVNTAAQIEKLAKSVKEKMRDGQ